MFISQLTSKSGFGELHFGEKLLTAVDATKEGGHSFLHDRSNQEIYRVYKSLPNCFQNISSWCPYQPAVQ